MKTKLIRFLRDEDVVTAIEYGLIAGLVAIAIIAGATAIGTDLKGIFNAIGTKLGLVSIT